MHTVWKGSISFGLVNIPVKMFTATEDKDIRFKYIHKECHSPVKYKKVCPVCNKEVQPDDIVRGFEYEPGKYVIMSGEDFESLQVKSEKAVEIVDFVKLEEVDPVYFDKTYFLAPQETGGKAYTLLREALGQKEKIAVAKITIRDRESLAVIRVYKNVLMLETIFYPDEVKDSSQVPGIPENAKTTQAELDMATQLIDNLTTDFDPSKYVDTYREKLVELINAKVEGKQVVARKEVEKENVVSLMEALKQSIQMSKGTNKNEKDKDADKADKSAKEVKNRKKDLVSEVETDDSTPEEKPKKRTRKAREKVES